MKVLALIGLLFVVGCATTPTRETTVPLDRQCDKVGMFARSVAIVRDIGVKENEFDSYVLGIQAQTFPVAYIRSMVYRETISPVDTYVVFYNTCVKVGYPQLLTEFQLGAELDELRARTSTPMVCTQKGTSCGSSHQ